MFHTLNTIISAVLLLSIALSNIVHAEQYRSDLPAPLSDEGWDLRLDKNGIQIYTRDWPGSDFIAFKAKQKIDSDLSNIVGNFLDIASFPDWVKDMVDAYEVEPFGDQDSRVTYMRMGLPWPLADRDVVSGQRVIQDPVTKVVHINEWYEGDMVPQNEGVIRTPRVNNQMVLIPEGEKSTTMVWQGHTEPGGYIPAFIVNFLLESVFYESVTNMKNRFESLEYRKTSDWVENYNPEKPNA